MKRFFSALIFLLTFLTSHGQEQYMIVGTYDSPVNKGIYVFKFDSQTGSAIQVSHLKTSNPSYLAVSPDQRFIYAVNENAEVNGKGGGVSSYSFDKTSGTLTEISHQSSQGNNPCYITVDKTGKWIIVGNYSSGNFSLLPVSKNGMLGSARQVIQHSGKGPDTARQESPHVHGIFLKKNNKNLYVTDLGTDKVMSYHFNAKKGLITPSKIPYVETSPGSGPRHITFSPDEKFVYLIQELSGTVSVFRDPGHGHLTPVQTISTVPSIYKEAAGSADIHVSADGKFLYASNRGKSNTIAVYSINKESGILTLVDHQATLGETPRNFNFDPSGKFLLVANQNSDGIVVFKRDVNTGMLSYTNNIIPVDKPVCIKWITIKE